MKKSILLVMLIFLVSVVSAETVEFVFSDVQDKVALGSEAQFMGSIRNNDDITHDFRFVVENNDWTVETDPRVVRVYPDGSESFDIKLSPLSIKKSGTYGVTVSAISNEDNSIRVKRTFDINYLNYNDFLDAEVDFPENFDPSTNNIARIIITNNENVELKNLRVVLKSKYFSGELDNINVEKNTKGTFNIKLDFQPGYKEGIYNVDLGVYAENQEVFD